MSTDFTPRIYGKYYLIDRIAVGGMAEVYAARSFSTGGFAKTLVIKRILERYSSDPAFVSMFIDEAKISVGLQHANIAQVYDFGKIKENYYLAMEWVDGRDIKQVFSRLSKHRDVLPVEFAVYIAHEVCKALYYAHNLKTLSGHPMGIVHQDISPSNIVVSFSGEVKVVDFGIAATQTMTSKAKDGINWGKVQYVAPERLRSKKVTPRSDLFSLGIVLHEMLTGRGLFRARDPKQSARRILAGDYPPPSAFNPAVPPELDRLVARALSLRPKDRFVDAGDMQEALFMHMGQRNPQLVQRSLALFQQELFGEQRRLQRARLERGSEVAQEFHEALGEVFDAEDRLGNRGSVPISLELLAALGRAPSDPTDVPMAPGVAPVVDLAADARGTGPHSGPRQSSGSDPFSGSMSGPLSASMSGPLSTSMSGPLSGPMSGPLSGPMSGPLPGSLSGPMASDRFGVPLDSGNFGMPPGHPRSLLKELEPEPVIQGVRPEHGVSSSVPKAALIAGVLALLGLGAVISWAINSQTPPLPSDILITEIQSRHVYAHGSALALSERAWQELTAGSWEGDLSALELLEQAVSLEPNSALALSGLALAYARNASERLAHGERAWLLLERARGLDPELPQVTATGAFLHLMQGEHQEATRAAERCTQGSLTALCSRLLLQVRVDQGERGLEEELRALEGTPADGPALQRLVAQQELSVGEVTSALSRLQRHDDLRSRLALSSIQMQGGQLDRALALIQPDAQAGQRDAVLRAAEIQLLRGQPQRTLRLLGPLLKDKQLSERDAGVHTLVLASSATLAIEDPRTALDYADRAFTLAPTWAPAQLALGRAALANQDHELVNVAIQGLDSSELPPWQQAALQLGVAELAIALGRPRFATLSLELAVDQLPSWMVLQSELARARMAVGDSDSANAGLAQAWSASPRAHLSPLVPLHELTPLVQPSALQSAAACVLTDGCPDKWRALQTDSPELQARLALLHDEPALALVLLEGRPLTWLQAQAQTQLGDPAATQSWQQLSQSEAAWLARARLARERGDSQLSAAAAQEALRLNPLSAEGLSLLLLSS